MPQNRIDRWIYAATRCGRNGASGYQTWACSTSVTDSEDEQLTQITSFFPSSEELPTLRSVGFARLKSGRFCIFQSQQGATDDLGRPSYQSEAFVFSHWKVLQHPPYAYLGSPSFTPLLASHQVSNTAPQPPLEPILSSDFLPNPNIPTADPHSWLGAEISGAQAAAAALVIKLFDGIPPKPHPQLIAEEETKVITAFGVAWHIADDEYRDLLSVSTLLPEVNQTPFTLAGWPASLGNPGPKFLSRFSGVFQWARKADPALLAGCPAPIGNKLVNFFKEAQGQSGLTSLKAVGIEHQDERHSALRFVQWFKTKLPVSQSDAEADLRILCSNPNLLMDSWKRERKAVENLLDHAPLDAFTEAELNTLIDGIGTGINTHLDTTHWRKSQLPTVNAQSIGSSQFHQAVKLFASDARTWQEDERWFRQHLHADGVGHYLIFCVRQRLSIRSSYGDTLDRDLEQSIRLNPGISTLIAETIIPMAAEGRNKILALFDRPSSRDAFLADLSYFLQQADVNDLQEFESSNPRWTGLTIAHLFKQNDGNPFALDLLASWARRASAFGLTHRLEFCNAILEGITPAELTTEQAVQIACTYPNDRILPAALMARIEQEGEKLLIFAHAEDELPIPHTKAKNLYSVLTVRNLKNRNLPVSTRSRHWQVTVDLLPHINPTLADSLRHYLLDAANTELANSVDRRTLQGLIASIPGSASIEPENPNIGHPPQTGPDCTPPAPDYRASEPTSPPSPSPPAPSVIKQQLNAPSQSSPPGRFHAFKGNQKKTVQTISDDASVPATKPSNQPSAPPAVEPQTPQTPPPKNSPRLTEQFAPKAALDQTFNPRSYDDLTTYRKPKPPNFIPFIILLGVVSLMATGFFLTRKKQDEKAPIESSRAPKTDLPSNPESPGRAKAVDANVARAPDLVARPQPPPPKPEPPSVTLPEGWTEKVKALLTNFNLDEARDLLDQVNEDQKKLPEYSNAHTQLATTAITKFQTEVQNHIAQNRFSQAQDLLGRIAAVAGGDHDKVKGLTGHLNAELETARKAWKAFEDKDLASKLTDIETFKEAGDWESAITAAKSFDQLLAPYGDLSANQKRFLEAIKAEAEAAKKKAEEESKAKTMPTSTASTAPDDLINANQISNDLVALAVIAISKAERNEAFEKDLEAQKKNLIAFPEQKKILETTEKIYLKIMEGDYLAAVNVIKPLNQKNEDGKPADIQYSELANAIEQLVGGSIFESGTLLELKHVFPEGFLPQDKSQIEALKEIQTALKAYKTALHPNGIYNGKIDGDWGKNTQNAVLAFYHTALPGEKLDGDITLSFIKALGINW
jgi:hypothetical protein